VCGSTRAHNDAVTLRRRNINNDNTESAATAPQPRVADVDRGLGWWTDGWALFAKSALLWVALGVILIVGLAVISMVPLLGSLASALLTPVLVGSWMLAARKVEQGGTLEVADLFTCFKGDRFAPLLVQGALLLAASVVIFLVAAALGMGAVMGMAAGGARDHMGGMVAAMGAGFFAMLAVLVLGAVVSMALWFGPALVVFRNIQPVDALRHSALAILKNWLPFLVYGLIGIVAAIVASIPFGLGWILLVPVTMLTMYVSYRDVFGV
jgi:uncharacterized membrane protein